MPFTPYYIIAAFDVYEEITRFRRDDGGFTYNPIKAHQYYIEEDAKLALELMDKLPKHHYFILYITAELLC